MPLHQRPPGRELGRRSEAAAHPFKRREDGTGTSIAPALRTSPHEPAAPLILVTTVGQRQVVTAVCPAARALGLTPGMAATQARALVPDLDVRPADPEADGTALDRLALHAVRHWTPGAAAAADGLHLDLTGAAHLFGGEARFCRRVVAFCRRLGLTARIAVADTLGAAHAAARHYPGPVTVLPPGDGTAAIASLPVVALRLTPEAIVAAARFGLDRIGDLLPMPRAPLARRLGLATVERLDQALGRVVEPIVAIVPFEPPAAERRLLEPIGTAEAIATVIGDVVSDLVDVLCQRGLGARAVEFVATRVDGIDQRQTIGMSRATRDSAHLTRMLCQRIERIDPGLGIEIVRLTGTRAEPLRATAMASVLASGDSTPDIAVTVDRLAGRVGETALFRARPVESDVPERAVIRVGVLEAGGAWPAWKRPVRLLRRPEVLTNVVALLPDHPPRRFAWRGRAHAVVAGDGPERVHGEWWRRDAEVDAVRDYYRVEDDRGARFWLFRRGDGVDPATGDLSWYMHGLFG
ncbi:Y-family DNA polymerase [Sphingomonas bacterium]|uniref:Y-family DNA polymerase n=1 Tax=Sphingomonas bacterium TaxID=1895847 RepID=UPI0020C61F6A|nr:DNA polymerase Y family protein [Sphingomonas bacterium]